MPSTKEHIRDTANSVSQQDNRRKGGKRGKRDERG